MKAQGGSRVSPVPLTLRFPTQSTRGWPRRAKTPWIPCLRAAYRGFTGLRFLSLITHQMITKMLEVIPRSDGKDEGRGSPGLCWWERDMLWPC